MGELWINRKSEDLLLHYAGILWGLQEEIHCLVRRFDGVNYVIPQISTVEQFETFIKPGMIDAKRTIEEILKKRRVVLKDIDLKMMSEEEMNIRTLGWQTYKEIQRSAMAFAQQMNRERAG